MISLMTLRTGFSDTRARFALSLLASAIVVLVACSCASTRHTAERGRPLDETAISQIVIGKTTRSEVFKLLGTPHSMFEGQAELTEGYSVFSTGEYYSHVENRHLSGIDDKHYVLLYRFGTMSTESKAGVALVVNWRNTTTKIRSDELLLFVNRETDIVDDVAYRKETPDQER